MKREELAWLAGIVEGEGCFGVVKTKTTTHNRIHFTLDMCDQEIVDKSWAILKLGHLYGPYINKGQPQYRWYIGKQHEVMTLAYMIWPWLSERRRQKIEECFQVWQKSPATRHRTKGKRKIT